MWIILKDSQFIRYLTLFLLLITVTSGDIYSNKYAVHIPGGEEVASSLALKYGFKNHGQIGMIENHFLFVHEKLTKRSAEVSKEIHTQLSNDPQIQFVEQQKILYRYKRDTYNFNDQVLSDEWYLRDSKSMSHHVYETWKNGFTGRDVVVSILDDGIEWNHPDLKDNYEPTASYDLNDNDDDPMPRYDPFNENKHGTRCAGVVSMHANNTICGVGIAYNAKIGGIRMLDGDVSDAVEAAALSYRTDVIDIYSSSWGPNDDGRTVDGPGVLAKHAVEAAVTKGRNGYGSIHVWASGNGGNYQDDCNCDGYANSIYTLTVSGVSESGKEPWYAEECSAILATTFSSGDATQKQVVTTDLHGECTEHHTGTSASAPMAAAMCALALEANPSLTWRDMQYIVAVTSNHGSLQDGNWRRNGAGHYVSNRYGFGLMDANRMTQMASVWEPLPKQTKCEIKGSLHNGALSSSSKLKVHLRVDGHCKNKVKYLEHVQVRTTLTYSARGHLNIWLTSPMGTRSRLLGQRPNDIGVGNFEDWPFMTTHNWGERANGTWTLEIDDSTRNSHNSGELYSWYLVLYGTETLPYIPTTPDPDVHSRKVRSEPKSHDSYDYYSSDYYYDDCHDQCYEPAGCSGSDPEDCYKCKLYRNRVTQECVSECPDGQFPPPGDHQRCRFCNSQCKTCFGHAINNCLSCNDGFYLREDTAKCVSQCDNGFFPEVVDGIKMCSFCDVSCYTCVDSADFCTSCDLGLHLNVHNRCVEKCDDNEYISDDTTCQVCNKACATCDGPEAQGCLTCKSNYIIKGDLCVPREKCSANYYISDEDECRRCHPACAECDGPEDHDCTKCPKNYVLVENHCLQSCGDRKYVNNEGNCADCPTRCKVCISNTTCIECVEDWVLVNGEGCQQGCPSGMYEMDHACYDCHATCSDCTGGDPHDCIKCQSEEGSERFLYNHKCLLACPDGYFKDRNHEFHPQCTKCDETCANCTGPTIYDCIECMDGLEMKLMNSDKKVCTEGEFKCPDHCICSNDIQCTGCEDGFYLYNRECIAVCPPRFVALTTPRVCGACHPSCKSCSGISHHECTTCIDSYYLTPDNTCDPDCYWFDNTYPDQESPQWRCSLCHHRCALCSGPHADDCIVCADGRYLLALDDTEGNLKHKCVESDECGIESYADETINECIPCYPTCRGCTGPDARDCVECTSSFKKDANGVCQSICSISEFATSDSDCKKCHPSCLSCTGAESTDCLTCDYGRYLMPTSGKCLEHCGDMYYPDFEDNVCKPCFPTCFTCVSYEDSECLTCKEGYYIHMGRYCLSQCPLGYYEFQGDELTCRQCSVECADCMGNYLNCTKCDNSEFLHKGRCLGQCPNGYEGKSGHCVVSQAQQDGYLCPHFCEECSDGYCTKCQNGYSIYFGGCRISNCNQKEYWDGTSCRICHASCDSCLGPSNQDCLSCPEGRLLENGECLQECPRGSYKDRDECGDCHPSCSTCSGPSQYDCESCAYGMYLGADKTCHNECPPGFYYDENTDCQACNQTCKTCNGPDANNCLSCSRETYLFEGFCIDSCPIERGYYHFLADEDESNFASSTNECRTCSNSCKMCFGGDTNQCTKCKENLFLHGNECVVNCGTYFYEEYDSNTCKHCNASCESCSGPKDTECITCQGSKFLVGGECLSNPPEHYYCIRTAYGKECRPCHASCLTCSKGGGVFDCDTCHPGHILDSGICYPRCASGTYFQNNTSSEDDDECGKCVEPCNDCYGPESSQCITCEDNMKMHHIDQGHHYCVTCCEEGKPTVEGKCCECNEKTGHCRPGLKDSNEISKRKNENNNRTTSTSSHVTAIILSCLGIIVLFFAIFGILQARSSRSLCFSSYERLPTYYNGSNVQVVLAKEPRMPNKHEYMSPEDEDSDEYQSDDDDDNEEIY